MDLIAGVPVRTAEGRVENSKEAAESSCLFSSSDVVVVRSHEGFRVIKTQRGERDGERGMHEERERRRTENRQEDVDDCTAAGR